ncbi:digalactosyldiacylglycerol synthase 1, chloroplastic-like [Phragmites australis]|uniref:digalactosyldiacylglycerol synthase 1, chloroplastic-like n=1 Tax=Phragmites australis TaxID=29695 RepID=UPI002D76634D|nr:digalactosyldiacylglycerol synthase 1, chloroplastic-like [Phragmites australis]
MGTEETGGSDRGGAFAFISKGWREVRDSAAADIRLMRARADREVEHLLASALALAVPGPSPPLSPVAAGAPIAELEFLRKRIQPKIQELRRQYSSRSLDGWPPRASGANLRVDLSGITAIRNAIVAEGDGAERWRIARLKGNCGEEGRKEWEVVRMIRSGLKEFEHRSLSSDMLGGFRGRGEFVEKFKLSLKSLNKDYRESKEVPPLDLTELLAYLVRQSGPFLDQLGVRRDLCDKLVGMLYSKRNGQLMYDSLSADRSLLRNENISDELDLRIARVLETTGYHTEEGFWADPARYKFSDNRRHVAIVTTASLPWMTGTAINPLFRAAYLARSTKQKVTLVVPWLSMSDQELVYPNNITFSSPEEQETYIRDWLHERLGFETNFKISFYPGKFSKERRSIIPAGDTSQFISSKEADIAILEEPEHLNWYHHGKRWTDKFNHVIGVVHTNYLEYIKREKNGALQAFLVKHINNWVTRAYCHKVLRLSAATQNLPRSVVCNVHGVNPKFLNIGEKIAADRECGQAFSKGAYFLGKMVWAKGYRELIDLLSKHKNDLEGFKLDVYGNGEDSEAVQAASRKLDLSINFFKGRDHADDSLHGYKVFINPSVSDVLCTATAEALAMGKFVICADHPSNDFFKSFPNCLTYKTSEEFVSRVKEAMASEPQPLTPEQRYNLSWEAATERFMEYSELDKVLNNRNGQPGRGGRINKVRKIPLLPKLSDVVDGGLAFAHHCLTGNEILRLATGAIPGTRDYDRQHCMDLNLLPPQVQHPVYG